MARRRQITALHMSRVYDRHLGRREARRLVDEVFASYARYWAESLLLPTLAPERVEQAVRYENLDHLETGLAAGRGAIIALPHLGGWEWAGTHLARRGVPMNVVVEPLEPADVFAWFVDFRESLGMNVIPVGPGAAARCTAALTANEVLCLLCDRLVSGASGVDVDFFGERTRLPAGPVTLALRTGAVLVPAAVYFSGAKADHLGVLRPPLELPRTGRLRADVAAGTQLLADELEVLIRRAPTQWHLTQPNWPSDPGFRAAESARSHSQSSRRGRVRAERTGAQ